MLRALSHFADNAGKTCPAMLRGMSIALHAKNEGSLMPQEPSHAGPNWWTHRRVNLNQEQVRILIVDDYEVGAGAMAEYLSLDGWDCRTAFHGKDAIALAIQWQPHFVMMDISMLELDGVEAAHALRNEPQTRDVVIIAFTSLTEYEVRRRGGGADFDGYFRKGQFSSTLVDFIRGAIA